jgi:uncharacterized protein YndB with AHSA1/START domain
MYEGHISSLCAADGAFFGVAPPHGTMPRMAQRLRGYAHRTDIAAGVQSVWRVLTETENLARWCSPDAWIRAKPGGLFRATVDRVTQLEAHIDVCEPARRLRLIYLPSEALPADETVTDDFMLTADPRGTILRLIGSGFVASETGDVQFRRMRTGWERALARLKVYVEQLERKAS